MRVLWVRVLVAVLICLLGGGCSTNLATGKKQLNFVSTSHEISLGNKSSPQFLAGYGGELPSPAVLGYTQRLGHRLAAVSERADLPWEFHVVDSAVLNAFALPGGKVFISRGLLSRLDNEAQLAGVLGHEIGHVTAQHIGQQMSRAMLLQGAAIGLGIASKNSDRDWLRVLGVGAQVGGTVYLLKFGRDQEVEADRLGVRYMTRLGYNPVGQVQVMKVLESEGAKGDRVTEFLSTHPLPQTRIRELASHIREHYPSSEGSETYRFDAEAFRSNVLEPLKELPPPRHGK